MSSIEEMTREISRLYNEGRFSYIDARELVIQGSGINSKYWPELRTVFGKIFGQRGGRRNKGKKKKNQQPAPLFSSSQIKMMVAQSLAVARMRGDHLLSDP